MCTAAIHRERQINAISVFPVTTDIKTSILILHGIKFIMSPQLMNNEQTFKYYIILHRLENNTNMENNAVSLLLLQGKQ